MGYRENAIPIAGTDGTRDVDFRQAQSSQIVTRQTDSPFGLRLREAFNGASNAEIQAKLGASSKSTVSNYMKGRIPDGETLIRIAQLANCDLHWLLTGEGENNEDPLGFLSQSQEAVLMRIARQKKTELELVLSEFLTSGMMARLNELLSRYQRLRPSEIDEMLALLELVKPGEKGADMQRDLKAG